MNNYSNDLYLVGNIYDIQETFSTMGKLLLKRLAEYNSQRNSVSKSYISNSNHTYSKTCVHFTSILKKLPGILCLRAHLLILLV